MADIDEDAKIFTNLFGAITFIVLFVMSCYSGISYGEEKGKCETHAWYARTEIDTLNVAQRYPECASTLFPRRD